MRRVLALAVVAAAGVATGGTVASAHTETDVVAVPAGEEAEVTLRPTHGCAGSPTVEVRIRAPFEGAEADEVDGWTATAESDGNGNTILTWTGGSLPADEDGAFPVAFTVPDDPGRLLLFPAVQHCEDGSELAWIDGDPTAEFPAPRVLILPAGSEPAETIDDVPLDAPGRDQLVAIVDVDAGEAAATTVPATEPPATTSAAPATTAPAAATTAPTSETSQTAAPVDATAPATTAPADDDDGGNTAAVVIGIGLVVAAVAAAVVLARRRRPRTP